VRKHTAWLDTITVEASLPMEMDMILTIMTTTLKTNQTLMDILLKLTLAAMLRAEPLITSSKFMEAKVQIYELNGSKVRQTVSKKDHTGNHYLNYQTEISQRGPTLRRKTTFKK
jgi:hypothetical protein